MNELEKEVISTAVEVLRSREEQTAQRSAILRAARLLHAIDKIGAELVSLRELAWQRD